MPTERINEDHLRDVLECFNQHDLDGILASFAEDAVFEPPRGPTPVGYAV
jgi:ketosteroid isomerase-like protein